MNGVVLILFPYCSMKWANVESLLSCPTNAKCVSFKGLLLFNFFFLRAFNQS